MINRTLMLISFSEMATLESKFGNEILLLDIKDAGTIIAEHNFSFKYFVYILGPNPHLAGAAALAVDLD